MEPLRFLQLTDLHLTKNPEQKLYDIVNTEESLRQLLQLISKTETQLTGIILTGDIADDASAEAYQRAAKYFDALNCPIYSLPGNHDSSAHMQQYLQGKNLSKTRMIEFDNWIIVLLDSTYPGAISGYLAETEIKFLVDHLNQFSHKAIVVCLHHQPVIIGSPMIDQYKLQELHQFWQVIYNHPQVKLILCGHVHQEYEVEVGHVRVATCPATCVQFKPGAKTFALDELTPGYRWIELYPDHSFKTGVVRL